VTEQDLSSAYRGARVLVLGAAGFLGRWVARRLTGHGAALVLVVRDRSSALETFARYEIQGELVVADLARPADVLPALVERAAPDIAFNLAGYGVDRRERDLEASRRVNAELPAALCRALAAAPRPTWPGPRVVHVGSALEYGEIGGDLAEDSPPNPTTVYGQTKLAGTTALVDACREHRLAGVVARLFTVYGPGEHEGRLLPALLSASPDRPLQLTSGLQRRDFTYVEDVAEGLLRIGIARTTEPTIVNLATSVLTSVRSFAETAAQELALSPSALTFGALPTRPEEMAHGPVSIAALRRLAGWSPTTDVRAGIARTRDFLRESER
jgi:nucleoside-diphosphate-sugar epimerase